MSLHTIAISERLYQKAKHITDNTDQTVDTVIENQLAEGLGYPLIDLPVAERDELKALAYLSDDALFTIMREQMQASKQERMSALLEKNSQGTITDSEFQEVTALVEDGDRLILRKATAMNLLLDRGHKLQLDHMNAPRLIEARQVWVRAGEHPPSSKSRDVPNTTHPPTP